MPVQSSLPKITRAPELVGLGPWHNSDPLTMAGLRGKVVLVDFWTFSCINCIRTLPYVQGYWEKYRDQPFVLIGVHTPEFVFEKSQANVAAAIERHGLTYPVAQDNDYGTWNAFSNRYWPAKYLIDAEGTIRYFHFGEGNYEETDRAIASLLAEIGDQDFKQRTEDRGNEEALRPKSQVRGPLSPETYLGERSWPAFAEASHSAQGASRDKSAGKPADPDDLVHYYEPPVDLPLHAYTLRGDWQLVDGEYHVLLSPTGEIRMHFLGGEINLVLGTQSGEPVHAEVSIDGARMKVITVDHHDLYNLFAGDYGEHELVLRIRGRGLAGYAFTFGG